MLCLLKLYNIITLKWNKIYKRRLFIYLCSVTYMSVWATVFRPRRVWEKIQVVDSWREIHLFRSVEDVWVMLWDWRLGRSRQLGLPIRANKRVIGLLQVVTVFIVRRENFSSNPSVTKISQSLDFTYFSIGHSTLFTKSNKLGCLTCFVSPCALLTHRSLNVNVPHI